MQYPVAFLQNINAPEIIIILMVILLFFGAKRMPELARSIGKSMREFKQAKASIEADLHTAVEIDHPAKNPKPSVAVEKA